MKEYRSYIKELSDLKSSKVFFNSGPDHAVVVFSSIFESANDNVSIFAGNMKGGISDNLEYVISLRNFLYKGGQLDITLEEYDETSPPKIFNFLDDFYQEGRVKVCVTPKRVLNNGKEVHFTVADSRMYRIETDKKNYLAKGNFNDSITSGILENIYSALISDNGTREIEI